MSRSVKLFHTAAGLLLLAIIVAAPFSFAQDDADVHIQPRAQLGTSKRDRSLPAALDTHTRPLRAETDLVLVPVTVTDSEDRVVTGLEKDNFNIFENKQKEAIASFSTDDAPISLGIVFDMSGSMSDKLDKAREAVVQFAQSANPADEFFIIGVSDKPQLISGFTSHVQDLQDKLLYTVANGKTALLDSIYMAMNEMRHANHRRKALLIISDGGDNNSRYTENEVKSVAEEADIQTFAVGIFDDSPRTDEEREGPELLSEITEATGGRSFTITDVNELADVASKIGMELRNEYLVGYKPGTKPRDGKWHKITVKLAPPKGLPPLFVYAKKGYYAQEQ